MPPTPPPSVAYVTYANTPDYLRGAQVLLRSLRAAGATAPFVLLIPESLPPMLLPSFAPAPTEIRRISDVAADAAAPAPALGAAAQPRYVHCLNKLAIWQHLTHYALVCWLDADMVVMENLDPLFATYADLPVGDLVAAPGCTCNALRNPRLHTAPSKCPFRHPKAAPPYINTGLFLTRPSRALYARMLTWDYDRPFPEQDAFSEHFAEPPRRIHVLPSRYNYLNHLPIAHPEAPTHNIAVFHFGYNKPWDGAGPLPDTEPIARWYYAYWHALDRAATPAPMPMPLKDVASNGL